MDDKCPKWAAIEVGREPISNQALEILAGVVVEWEVLPREKYYKMTAGLQCDLLSSLLREIKRQKLAESERDALRRELDGIRTKALTIPADRLELLADWFDLHEADEPDAGVEVQLDLRRWARTLREISEGGNP